MRGISPPVSRLTHGWAPTAREGSVIEYQQKQRRRRLLRNVFGPGLLRAEATMFEHGQTRCGKPTAILLLLLISIFGTNSLQAAAAPGPQFQVNTFTIGD